MVAKTKVRASVTTRFLTIVVEISLAVFISVVTNNLDRVFVGSHSTIGTQAIETSFESTFWKDRYFRKDRQRFESNVVNYTYSELVHWIFCFQVVENRNDVSRSSIFRRQTITTTYNHRFAVSRDIFASSESFNYVHVQWVAISTGFFSSVKNAYTFYCFRNNST